MLAERHNREADALAAYRGYLALDPRWEEGWFKIGGFLLGRREWQAALEAYDHAVELAPANVLGYIGRGQALAGLARDQEAVAALSRALELDPERERDILAKLAPLYSKDLSLDTRLAAEVTIELAQDATVQDAVAALMAATGVPMFAHEPLADKRAALEAAPHPAAETMQALAASSGGKWRFERGLYLLEPDVAAIADLDHLTPELEQDEVIAKCLAEAAARPEWGLPVARLALELSRRGYDLLALQYAEEAAALDPQAMPPGLLARYYEKRGRLIEAARLYEQAAEAGNAAAQSSLADVLWRLGDFDRAVEARRACIAQSKIPDVVRATLASDLFRIGRLSEAREEIRLAIQAAPDDDRRQKRGRLLELIEKRAADPQAAQKLLQTGQASMRFGQYVFAAESFAAAVNLDPTLTEAKTGLEEARQALREGAQ